MYYEIESCKEIALIYIKYTGSNQASCTFLLYFLYLKHKFQDMYVYRGKIFELVTGPPPPPPVLCL